jgi:hypothetical protein
MRLLAQMNEEAGEMAVVLVSGHRMKQLVEEFRLKLSTGHERSDSDENIPAKHEKHGNWSVSNAVNA